MVIYRCVARPYCLYVSHACTKDVPSAIISYADKAAALIYHLGANTWRLLSKRNAAMTDRESRDPESRS